MFVCFFWIKITNDLPILKIDSIILILTPFGDIFLYLICEIYLGQLKFGYVKNDVQVSVFKKNDAYKYDRYHVTQISINGKVWHTF